MSDYTIYCTEQQTRKALELCAPINFNKVGEGLPSHYFISREKKGYYEIPTAEQMIGWLEEHIDNIEVLKNNNGKWVYLFYPTQSSRVYESKDKFLSRKEATIAAIDLVLEYLTKAKEEQK